jgi:hypothetical protein
MKWILSATTLVLAFSAHASDHKIGNVIAVERSISNVYNTCLDQVKKDDGRGDKYFACKYSATKDTTENAPGSQHLIFNNDTRCTVDVTLQNNVILILFNSNDAKAGLSEAQNCLRMAMNDAKVNDTLKFIVYTVE